MAINKTSNFYNSLPPWSRGIVVVIGVSGIALLTYSVYKNLKAKKERDEANKQAEQAKLEFKELKKTGIVPTYSASQYEGFAQKLVQAMDSCGTSESSIYSVFQSMKNKADVLSLITAFSVRYYTPCSATNPISYAQYIFNNKAFGGSLATWLEYDLTNSEIAKINKILEEKNIDYKF
jgi:hypothetical protein